MARPRSDTPRYRLSINRSGKYQVVWFENGITRTASTGTANEIAAKSFLAQFVEGKENPAPPSQPIIELILSGYYEDRERAGIKSLDSAFRNCKNLARHIGKLEPHQVSQNTIRKYTTSRIKEGVGNSSILRELAILRAAFHWADREHWIGRAPEFRMPVQPSKPRQIWATREEIAALLEAAEQTPHIKLFILIAVSTGQRKSAICNLTWKSVDFKTNRIDFGEDVGNKKKSVVPISKGLRAELEYHYRFSVTDHVLEFQGNPTADIKKAFKRCADRAGLPHITPHVLRHTAATWLVMEGISIRQAARYLGMSEEVFEGIYGKHSPDYLKDAADTLDVTDALHRKPYIKPVKSGVER